MGDKKEKVVWGKIAYQFKGVLDSIKAKELANKKIIPKEIPNTKSLLEKNPQQAIIMSRLKRYRPTIKSYCLNYLVKGLSKDEFIGAVKSSCSKILMECGNMSRILLTKGMINTTVDSIGSLLDKTLQELSDNNINDVNYLTNMIIDGLANVFNQRLGMTDYERIHGDGIPQKVQEESKTLVGLLNMLPESDRDQIRAKLQVLGINPNDEYALKTLVASLGLDYKVLSDQVRAGKIPDALKGLL